MFLYFRFAKQLGHTDWTASNGWLHRFNQRHGLTSKKACGESAAVPQEVCSNYTENVLPELLAKYDPDDIFNIDETGLFYRLLPDRTYCFKEEKCHGGKHSKERLTLLLGANMSGTCKLKPFVIGKYAKPRCFTGIRPESLGVDYTYNKKAWMTCKTFDEYLLKWNSHLVRQNRKICLLIDNCPAHALLREYSNIEIHFLPPNTTSKLQPMDLGVIKKFKSAYRRYLVEMYLHALEQRQDLATVRSKIHVKAAIEMSVRAWNDVSPTTISKCFRKAGFHAARETGIAEADTPDVAEEPQPQVDRNLWDTLQDELGFTVTFVEYVNCDEDVPTTEPMTDETIIESVLRESQRESAEPEEEEEEDDTPLPPKAANTELTRQAG